MNKSIVLHKSNGFTLVEVMFAILLISILGAYSASSEFKKLLDVQYGAVGMQTNQHRQALENYIFANYADLSDPSRNSVVTANTGVTNVLQPTFAELSAASENYMPALMASSSVTVFNQTMTYRVFRQGVCPGANCNVFGLAYPNASFLTQGGALNDGAAISAMLAMGAFGGASYTDTPSVIRGMGGAWTEANPAGAVGSMVFGLAAGNLSIFNAFYKKRGDTLLGTMNAGNQNIINGNDFNARRLLDTDNNTFLLDPNAVSNLTTVNFVDGRVSARSAVVNASDMLCKKCYIGSFNQANLSTVPVPTCAATGTPDIEVSMQRALGIDGFQIPAPLLSGGLWTVRVLSSDGVTPVPGATFTARTTCNYA